MTCLIYARFKTLLLLLALLCSNRFTLGRLDYHR